jgi:hypothetical protein
MVESIATGTRIKFQDETGERLGVVKGCVRDISNGQQFAIVEVDHEFPGILEKIPMADLVIHLNRSRA